MNHALRDEAKRIIGDDGATQHQKLNMLLALQVDLQSEVTGMQDSNPFYTIPKRWRKRVLGLGALWSAWVTINLFGFPISPKEIFEFVTDLL